MSSTARPPRRLLVPALAMAAAVALTGCAAGQISQTADQVAAIDGANGSVGNLTILNAQLAEPRDQTIGEGSNSQLLLWISNAGLEADTLTGITTPYAAEVRITGDAQIPGQTLTDLATSQGTRITVEDFTQEVVTGNSVPMTFSFQKAGSIDLDIPVQLPPGRSEGRETIEILPPHPTPLWETGLHGEEEGHSAGGGEGHSEETRGSEGAGTTAAVTETSGAASGSGSESGTGTSFVPSGTALAATTGGSEGESGAGDEGR